MLDIATNAISVQSEGKKDSHNQIQKNGSLPGI